MFQTNLIYEYVFTLLFFFCDCSTVFFITGFFFKKTQTLLWKHGFYYKR